MYVCMYVYRTLVWVKPRTVFPVSVVVNGCAAGGGVPLVGAVPALSWCGEVYLGGKHICC